MINIDVKVNDLKLISSSVVLFNKESSVDFYLNGKEDAETLVVKFKLTNDTSFEKGTVKADLISDTELEIKLINYDNSKYVGTKIPIEIGEVNGEEVYLMFVTEHVSKTSDVSRITFNWYIKERD